MVKMTGGQALMKSLYQEGVRVIFGLPGVQLYHALDALDALYEQPEIRLITTRHEQATTPSGPNALPAFSALATLLTPSIAAYPAPATFRPDF